MSYSLPETGNGKNWYKICMSDATETDTGFLVPVSPPSSGTCVIVIRVRKRARNQASETASWSVQVHE